MTDGFNSKVKKDLDLIAALAVDPIPVEKRLQKLIFTVSSVLEVSAGFLLLHDELPLSPKFLYTVLDEKSTQNFQQAVIKQFKEQIGNGFKSLALASDCLSPYSQTISDSLGEHHSCVVVPLFVGTQQLGLMAFVTPRSETILREKASLLHILVDQVGLLLLVLKNSEAEKCKTSLSYNESIFTEEFLAALSHELRAPLHAILGWVSVLQHPTTTKETWEHALRIIERSARAQSHIINDLLDASLCFNQQPHLNKRPVSLHSILHQVIKTLSPVAEQKEITLTKDIKLSDEYVLAEPERLRQVFWHLLSNAIKFTMKKGQIHLSARQCDDQFEIVVTDSGIGIAPEFMPHVFAPFRQESSLTTRKFGGLGLGLAIARHQIELHGGSIEVMSAGKQQGTTVKVYLPYKPSLSVPSETVLTPISTTQKLGAIEEKSLDGLRVLVVDDDIDSLEIVSTILQNCNSEVQTAASGYEALDLLKRWEPDILISDLQMPGIDGYELMRQLRREKLSLRRRVATVALTAYSRAEDRLKALASGFHTHLSKPVDPTELVAVVTSLGKQTRQTYSLI